MLIKKIIFLAVFIHFGFLHLGFKLYAETLNSPNSPSDNRISADNRIATRSMTNSNFSRLFKERDWIVSYGLGFGRISQLFYGLGFSRDPYHTAHANLYVISATAAADYFFGDYFDLGVDLTMGGNLNKKVMPGEEQANGGNTDFFILMTAMRGFIHYPFSIADVYGGLSLGLGLTRQTFSEKKCKCSPKSNNQFFWGWVFRLGSRFRLSDNQGVITEVSFPIPWIMVGGYYQIK